jgi:nucleoside phosphorylase
MTEIGLLAGDKDARRQLFKLLGKDLGLVMNSTSPVDVTSTFAEVERQIRAFSTSLKQGSRPTGTEGSTIDIAIICALHDPELAAVLALSPWGRGPQVAGDPQTYHTTTWLTKKGQSLCVVAAAPNHMGLTAAGVLAAKMVLQFQPRLVAMVGIAAGAKEKAQGFGDILVPEQTFDYGSGKTIAKGKRVTVLPNPNPLPIRPKALGRIKEWQRERAGLDGIQTAWQAAQPRTRLQLHTGPMFSSPTVLQTDLPIQELAQQWRKLAGIEMEAHAVHRACTDTIDPPPMFLCAKSICDFAEGKDDKWQHYAAYTSARFLQEFVVHEWDAGLVSS